MDLKPQHDLGSDFLRESLPFLTWSIFFIETTSFAELLGNRRCECLYHGTGQ